MTEEKLKYFNLLSLKLSNIDKLIYHFGYKIKTSRKGEEYSYRKFGVFMVKNKRSSQGVRISFADTCYGSEIFVDNETVDIIVESLKVRREQLSEMFKETLDAEI